MAIKIYAPSDFVADTGWNGRSYPIEDLPDDSEVIYDKMMQNTSHIQANLEAPIFALCGLRRNPL